MSALEQRLQAAMLATAARWRDVERIGPFTAAFARGSGHPSLDYAVPDGNAEPETEEVEALVAAFRTRDLPPRLEYVPALAPAVEPSLLAAGFAVDLRAPLLVLGREGDAPAPPGVELAAAGSDDDVRAVAEAQHEAYGESEPPTESWLRGVRRSLDAGGVLVLARDVGSGRVVGGGQCTAPENGAAELTSIGVRPAFRRRGIAAAITAWLVARMAERDVDLVYLTAAGDAEARVYERVGFERIGEALHVSLPAGE